MIVDLLCKALVLPFTTYTAAYRLTESVLIAAASGAR